MPRIRLLASGIVVTFVVGVVSVATGLGSAGAQQPPAAAAPADVDTVTSGDLTRAFTASGTLRAESTWTVPHQADPTTVVVDATPAASPSQPQIAADGSDQPQPADGSQTQPAGPTTRQVPTTAVVTSLPDAGAVIQPGGALYAIDGRPTILLPGPVAAWRTLAVGVGDGPDVAQLEAFLAGAGFDPGTVDAHFDAATRSAVKAWQAAVGRPQTGVVELGSVVFAPGPLTVESSPTRVGATVGDDDPVLVVRSSSLVVEVAVGSDLAPYLAVGDEIQVRLPDRSSVAATVTAAVDDPTKGRTALATLSQLPKLAATPVPVTVTRTVIVAKDALMVPVGAVLHLEGGVDAVRRSPGGGLVAVQIVQVSGAKVAVTSADLHPGDRVLT